MCEPVIFWEGSVKNAGGMIEYFLTDRSVGIIAYSLTDRALGTGSIYLISGAASGHCGSSVAS